MAEREVTHAGPAAHTVNNRAARSYPFYKAARQQEPVAASLLKALSKIQPGLIDYIQQRDEGQAHEDFAEGKPPSKKSLNYARAYNKLSAGAELAEFNGEIE